GSWPVKNNATFARAAILTDEFRSGKIDTALISRREGELTLRPEQPSINQLKAIAEALLIGMQLTRRAPAVAPLGWRLNSSATSILRVAVNGVPEEVPVEGSVFDQNGWTVLAPQAFEVRRHFVVDQG